MSDIKTIIEDVKSRIDIVNLINEYINVEQSGNNFKALCPFHNEKTPSFCISEQKQIYKCFGCGEGGDVIGFVMKMENLDFLDAVKFLANKYGIDVSFNINEEQKQKIEKTKKYIDINTETARFYFRNLFSQKNKAYEYLKSRGLDDKIIKKFGLGYSQDSFNSLKNYLLSKNFEINDLIECGLITKKNEKIYDKFRNRIMFPIFDYKGNVIGFGGRVLDDSLPKYLNSPETIVFNKSNNLYGINFTKKEIKDKTVILVEGYMDLITLYQYGIKNVFASLGTSLTKNQALLIKKCANTVIISYDKDDAGIKATLRAIEILTSLDINVKVLDLKESKDPDEFIRKYGKNEFEEAIKNSSHHIKFKIDLLKKNYNTQNENEKIEFTQKAINIIKTLKNNVEIDYFANYLSKITGSSIESIKMDIYGYGKKYSKKNFQNNSNINNNYNKEKEKIEKVEVKFKKFFVEEYLIKILIEDVKNRNYLLSRIDEKDFFLNESKEILKYIIKNQDLDKISIDKLKSLNISEEYINDLIGISIKDINDLNVKCLDDIIKNTKKNTISNQIEYLQEKAKKLEQQYGKNSIESISVANEIFKLKKNSLLIIN